MRHKNSNTPWRKSEGEVADDPLVVLVEPEGEAGKVCLGHFSKQLSGHKDLQRADNDTRSACGISLNKTCLLRQMCVILRASLRMQCKKYVQVPGRLP